MRKSKSNATATASISASTSYKTSSSTTLTPTPPRPLSPLPPPLLHTHPRRSPHTRLHRERNRAPYMLSDLIATTHRLSETLPSELWESSAVFGLRRDGRSGELQVKEKKKNKNKEKNKRKKKREKEKEKERDKGKKKRVLEERGWGMGGLQGRGLRGVCVGSRREAWL
ncbi:hypothetical protein PTNB85_00494 [Pyrenophora teres f. teres]|nr:hypothetical protein PTNB85_00494 [Pyrenophora teres f. teres]